MRQYRNVHYDTCNNHKRYNTLNEITHKTARDKMKVLAAMSGGVDSAVAAYIAKQQGHEVTGVHMALMRNRSLFRTGSQGCCTIEDANDAKRAADIIGIPFYVWDLSESFQKNVVQDFINEYKSGRTPNPCIRCNEFVKFQTLKEKAKSMGFDAVVTGHYARVVAEGSGSEAEFAGGEDVCRKESTRRLELHRAKNFAKDQSYVLAVMGYAGLKTSIFPLGDFDSKDDVRKLASELGLPVSHKPESFDVCFIEKNQTKAFLSDSIGTKQGDIIEAESGKAIAKHNGAWLYTVGQRRGLDIKVPTKDGLPRYVISTDTTKNEVYVGPKEMLLVEDVRIKDIVYMDEKYSELISFPGKAQIRAHGEAISVSVAQASNMEDNMASGPTPNTASNTASGSNTEVAELTLHATGIPFSSVAKGQSLVLYDNDNSKVILQGTIC
jgi:tRNA-specific 2-thiouridylase